MATCGNTTLFPCEPVPIDEGAFQAAKTLPDTRSDKAAVVDIIQQRLYSVKVPVWLPLSFSIMKEMAW